MVILSLYVFAVVVVAVAVAVAVVVVGCCSDVANATRITGSAIGIATAGVLAIA